jgi:hypothetical protein
MSWCRPLCIILVAAVLAGCARPHVAPSPYAVRTSFSLARARDGIDGRIELLEDARIRPEHREAIRQAWGFPPCGAPIDSALTTLCRDLGGDSLPSAVVRVVSVDGTEIDRRALERPLGELSTVRLYGDARPTYLVTVDLSAGMGSYSGPLTRFAELYDGRLRWLLAARLPDESSDTLTVAVTLKTGWRFWPRADGAGQDILLVACRPDFDAPTAPDSDAKFRVTFTRFSFERGRWVERARSEPGFWENEDDSSFPPRTSFP